MEKKNEETSIRMSQRLRTKKNDPKPKAIRKKKPPSSVPAPAKEEKAKGQTKTDISKKVKTKLKAIPCNILTGDCLKCEKVKTCKKANGDFTQISNAMPFHLLPLLTGNAMKLYLYFCARAGGNPKDGNFGKCWPGNALIEEETGVNRSHIWEYITELKALNLIHVYYKQEGQTNKKRFIYVTWHNKIRAIRKLKTRDN